MVDALPPAGHGFVWPMAGLTANASESPAMTRCFFMIRLLLVENDLTSTWPNIADAPRANTGGPCCAKRCVDRTLGCENDHADTHIESSEHLEVFDATRRLELLKDIRNRP